MLSLIEPNYRKNDDLGDQSILYIIELYCEYNNPRLSIYTRQVKEMIGGERRVLETKLGKTEYSTS